jgi:hypothetical protein
MFSRSGGFEKRSWAPKLLLSTYVVKLQASILERSSLYLLINLHYQETRIDRHTLTNTHAHKNHNVGCLTGASHSQRLESDLVQTPEYSNYRFERKWNVLVALSQVRQHVSIPTRRLRIKQRCVSHQKVTTSSPCCLELPPKRLGFIFRSRILSCSPELL